VEHGANSTGNQTTENAIHSRKAAVPTHTHANWKRDLSYVRKIKTHWRVNCGGACDKVSQVSRPASARDSFSRRRTTNCARGVAFHSGSGAALAHSIFALGMRALLCGGQPLCTLHFYNVLNSRCVSANAGDWAKYYQGSALA